MPLICGQATWSRCQAGSPGGLQDAGITPIYSTFSEPWTIAQGLFDYLLRGRNETARKLTHGTFEVFSLPYTTLRVGEHNAVPDGTVPDEQ